MLIFMFFILILNAVAIALTYYCLETTERKDKLIFIAIGIAIMYMLTSFIYWISSKNIDLKEISETGKNLITFLFVPINGILVLPLFAKSYTKYKNGRIQGSHLRNRGILLSLLLLVVLIIECSYFADIQNTVLNMINAKKSSQEITQAEPDISNEIANTVENTVTNSMTNIVETSVTNQNVVEEKTNTGDLN